MSSSVNSTDDNQSKRIAFVQACWHEDIVNQGKLGFLEKIAELGFAEDHVDFFEMPGAFEIPLKCQSLCKSGKYSAVVAAGFVVDGGIYQHEFVAQAVISGLMNVQLEQATPVLSMILTPKNYDESEERNHFFYEHFRVKGHEAAQALKAVLANY